MVNPIVEALELNLHSITSKVCYISVILCKTVYIPIDSYIIVLYIDSSETLMKESKMQKIIYNDRLKKFYITHDGLSWYSLKNIGKRMSKILQFAIKYHGWMSFHKSEKVYMERLASRGYIELNSHNQFKLTGT